METHSFAPQAVVDGVTVTPENWMWIVALAMNGVGWAVKLADDPVFDMRGKIVDYERRRRLHSVDLSIEDLEQRLAQLRAERNDLLSVSSPPGIALLNKIRRTIDDSR